MKPDKRREILENFTLETHELWATCEIELDEEDDERITNCLIGLNKLDLDKGELHRCICGGGEGSIDDCEQADLIVNNILSKLKEKREGNAD